MRLVPRVGLAAVALAIAGVALPTASASANPAATYEATMLAEAWYRAAPVDTSALGGCGIPAVGCAPAAPVPSQYPAGTLHVGVSGGTEDSRTYLTLVGASVPLDADVVGGTLTLPVATDSQAGTVAPETAQFRACLATGKVNDGVEGGLYGAPEVDCATSSPAVFAAGHGGSGPAFTVDLTPFAAAFSAGQVSLGLVPGESPGTEWHVAFSRNDRAAEGARPITAQLRTGTEQRSDQPADSAQDAAPLAGGGNGSSPVAAGLEDAPLSPSQLANTDAPPLVADKPAVAAQPVALIRRSLASPIVFLLPLVLVCAFAWVCRVFTRELLPVRG